MNSIWTYQGEVEETELLKMTEIEKFDIFVAFLTDRFLSGHNRREELEQIPEDKLLELRVFNESGEFLARRTMIGAEHKFQWRIASERDIKETDEIEFMTSYQTLDIDAVKTREGKNGNLALVTTGGGSYELPIKKEEDTVKVVTYIGYDSDGMAYIYDNRIVGFVKSEEMKNA